MRRVNPAVGAAAALVAVFLVAPTLVVIPLSFTEYSVLNWPPHGFSLKWYDEVLTDPTWRSATMTSLKVGAGAALAATVLGTGIALGLSRGRFRGKNVATIAILSPMIVPVVITAVANYFVFVKWGLTGTAAGLIAAHTVLGLPFVVVSVSNSLSRFDRNQENAAYSLGASPLFAFFTVTLPQLLPGVLSGALFAFITSWDEAIISQFLSSPQVRTLPSLIFSQISSGVDPSVAAAASILLAVTAALLASASIIGAVSRRKRSS
ncbi:ABC transporter permease [Streptomyces colonosanans]|uniref:ABC transmembrane type-1 domain-containing protein n=1 Tax=Streptomyces colonosanans TaxID=1428652 RepID=A0A1S2P442_9ACTN|nr:ABC transporter permease [Streptomyces colonosanans]OIJ88421.1 hypothetical protein BIV24_23005 [Streptomyces colonosanans]